MFSTGELTRLRAMQEDFLPDTCTIQTLSTARTSRGGTSESWANTYTNVPCRLAVTTRVAGEQQLGDRVQSVTYVLLTILRTQAVSPRDRVIKDGVTYEITSVSDGRTDALAKTLQLTRIV